MVRMGGPQAPFSNGVLSMEIHPTQVVCGYSHFLAIGQYLFCPCEPIPCLSTKPFLYSGAHLDGLQAVFAKDRAELVTTVRYEGLSAPEISAEIRTAVPVEGSKWFSNFTQ